MVMGRWLRYSVPALLLLLAGRAWQAVVESGAVPDFVLPPPTQIWDAAVQERSLLLSNAVPTLEVAVGGFLLALVIGVALAIAIASSRLLRAAVYPLVVGSQTVPVLALAPALALIFGYSVLPKLVIVCLVCFFPITVNTVDGLRSVDQELLSLLRSMGAGPAALFREVSLPSALPYLFSGAKVAATFSVIGALFGEWSGSYSGLGYFMQQRQAQFDTAGLFAAIAALTLLGIALFGAVALLERLLIPWHRSSGDALLRGDRP
jgi:ABC-type nitrate/sulfonate/bicarbonate transport system permease component